MSDPQLFEPPEPVAVPASRRPLLAPGDAAKRLRVIATGMRAAADSGLARPVLAADIAVAAVVLAWVGLRDEPDRVELAPRSRFDRLDR